MSWSLYRWTWLFKSPLYVGMPPAGSLNRCRLYVPARAMWGAVTAEVARAQAANNFPRYADIGKELCKHTRFTYLFTAERAGSDWHAWLPCCVADKGLVWEREDAVDHRRSDREFRMRLLSTRPSTAIEPSSDTAAEGSLRETECLNTQWRSGDGLAGGPVGLVGYIFLHADLHENVRKALEQLMLITVGGDTRYGLGRLWRIEMKEATHVFGCNVNLDDGADPGVQTKRILAHADAQGNTAAKGNTAAQGNTAAKENKAQKLSGALELLRGWDYGKSDHWCAERALWVPGTAGEAASVWRIDDSGLWYCDDRA